MSKKCQIALKKIKNMEGSLMKARILSTILVILMSVLTAAASEKKGEKAEEIKGWLIVKCCSNTKNIEKTAKNTRYEGVPAKMITMGQFKNKQDYILHKECIQRVAQQVFQVYNFC